jgi:hypothetical protein
VVVYHHDFKTLHVTNMNHMLKLADSVPETVIGLAIAPVQQGAVQHIGTAFQNLLLPCLCAGVRVFHGAVQGSLRHPHAHEH